MKRYFLNGIEISDKTGFKDEQGASYPSGWLSTMPEEALGNYDITVVVETPEEIIETPKQVLEVTKRQASLELLDAGILNSVQEALEGLPSPLRERALVEWATSSTVQRNHELTLTLGNILQLSSEQLDALFLRSSLR